MADIAEAPDNNPSRSTAPGRRLLGTAGVLALLIPLVAAGPVQAQTNDDRASAAVVTEPLPYSDSVDTTSATGAPDDPGCTTSAGNLNNPTVWYSYTPSSDGFVGANTFGSNYDTELSAYVDDGSGGLTQIACNDDAGFGLQSEVVVEAVAGVEILFMAGSCCGSSDGGQLRFSVDQAPEPLTASLSLGDSRVSSADGVVHVSGSIECSRPAEAYVSVNVNQTRGGAGVLGFGETPVSCDGPTAWTAEVEPFFGTRFSGGRADVGLSGYAFDGGQFVSFDGGTSEVRLRGTGPADPGPEPRVDVTTDIEYGSADGDSLLLDLYEPGRGSRADRAAVIFAHGGGFTSGSKSSGVAVDYATDLAGAGVVAASINYRLNGITAQGLLDAQHDMQAAVRWFRTNAGSLGVDPDRIFVMGYSAGAVTSMYTNFNSENPGSSGNPGVSSEVAGGISLAGFGDPNLIDPGEPPVLMFHGTNDGTVPFGAARGTCTTTIAAGNSCDFYPYEGVGHYLESFHDEIVDLTLEFVGTAG